MIRFDRLFMLGTALSLAVGTPVSAQQDDGFLLEEIIVTARKREESLQEVPVSISVLTDNLIEETGILTQEELFQLVPGIYYDEGPDRNAAFPSVRGVQSNEIATNRTKVTAFVDGMPILGSQGSLGFGNLQQVEVYRGPQSAAFGRSTFGGAINYVTRDPGEEFEGNVSADVNGYGRRLMRAGVSGPISDTAGFMLNAEYEDSTAPDDYLATNVTTPVTGDAVQYGERSTESIGGKLTFSPSDNLDVKLTFSNIVTFDTPGVAYYISQEARDACFANNGITYTGMGTSLYVDGTYDCDDWSQGAPLYQQNDRSLVLAHAFDNPDYAGQFPQYQGLTPQQQDDLLFLARSESVFGDYFSAHDERSRVSIQTDYLMDNGHAIQFTAFTGEENYIRGADGNRDPYLPITFTPPNPMAMGPQPEWTLQGMGPLATIGTIMSDPTDISESYAEVRWVSPAEDRLRYVAGVSYYDYDFLTTLYFGGYGAVAGGDEAVQRYIALTGDDPSIPDQLLGESASNTAVFFNATYDVTERLAVSIEGRYQDDYVFGEDTISGNSGSVSTKAFVPRLSFNYNVNEDTSFYGQFARGNNPAGVNVGFFNETLQQTLAASQWVAYTLEDVRTFDEEQLTNLEFGIKGSALDGRLQYATAIYVMEWEGNVAPLNLYWGDPSIDPMFRDGSSSNRTFLNQGDQEMKGAEFEGNFFITDSFSIRGALGLLDAKYTNFCDVGIEGNNDLGPYAVRTGRPVTFETDGDFAACYRVDGLDAREQPTVTGSVSPSYRGVAGNSGIRWNARADVRFESDQWLDSANIAKTPGVVTINASAGLNGENWGATLYINNLLDDDTPRRLASGDDVTIDPTSPGSLALLNVVPSPGPIENWRVTPRAPRTIGLRLNYNF